MFGVRLTLPLLVTALIAVIYLLNSSQKYVCPEPIICPMVPHDNGPAAASAPPPDSAECKHIWNLDRDCSVPYDMVSATPGVLPMFNVEADMGRQIVCKMANGNDFETEWAQRLIPLIDGRKAVAYHRKQWESAYIAHVVESLNLCGPGKRGMTWGAGKERLVSYFASKNCDILASDHNEEDAWRSNWSQQKAAKEKLYYPHLIDKQTFEKRVWFRHQDLNHMPIDLRYSFDFVWTVRTVEHIGSILLGQRFIMNSLDMLRPGGVAMHSFEFTLSSDSRTVDHGSFVLWRKRDVERLAASLRELRYEVFPIVWGAGSHRVDKSPDEAPYKHYDHVKLVLAEHIVTSFIIVVRKPYSWGNHLPPLQNLCENPPSSLEEAALGSSSGKAKAKGQL
ncbi:hypothetical protein BJ742DRAFT_831721 [Cladochytrium replicatum]|nr:hypothetical protein BJ742DRAFT_831721 [Cladochytrium replicatum]